MRRLLGLVVTASFALSVLTWGSVAGCGPAQLSASQSGHHHAGASSHRSAPAKAPGGAQCLVHLCCVQLASPVGGSAGPEDRLPVDGHTRLTAFASIVPLRSPHALPFAHAPPALRI
jgi:hypothetical protein